jgi:exopolysaccharide biosynthesis polyprenyl glycosylphosphotransferase
MAAREEQTTLEGIDFAAEPSSSDAPHLGARLEHECLAPTAHRPAAEGFRRTRTWMRRTDFASVVLALFLVHVYALLGTLLPNPRTLSYVSFPLTHVLVLLACALIWLKVHDAFSLYAPACRTSVRSDVIRLSLSTSIGTAFAVAAQCWISSPAFVGDALLPSVILLWTSVLLLVMAARFVAWRVYCATAARSRRHIMIVGSGPLAVECYNALRADSRGGTRIMGFVDSSRQPALAELDIPLLGSLDELEVLLGRVVVDEIRIALPLKSCYAKAQRAIRVCEMLGVPASYSIDAFDCGVRPHLSSQGETPVLRVPAHRHYSHLIWKRTFDLFVSGIGLILLSPVVLLIAVLVAATSEGPVFFAQERFGRNKRRFKMYKFRSMRRDAEHALRNDPMLLEQYRRNSFKLPEGRDARVTRIGGVLRKTSLDELPQLWNVFKGDMSVIGPRPIVPDEIAHYGRFAPLLLALKPGLTGAWVVNGRSRVGYPRRAQIELEYVREWSFWHDLKIFVRTIPALLLRRGAH